MFSTKERRRFQPCVIELETRITPSTSRVLSGAMLPDLLGRDQQPSVLTPGVRDTSAITASARGGRVLGLAQPRPLAKMNFAPLPADQAYTLEIKLVDRNG